MSVLGLHLFIPLFIFVSSLFLFREEQARVLSGNPTLVSHTLGWTVILNGINPSFGIEDLFAFIWNSNLGAAVVVGIRSDLPFHLRSLKVGSVIMRVFKVYPSCEARVVPLHSSAKDFMDELSAMYTDSISNNKFQVMLDVGEIFTGGFS